MSSRRALKRGRPAAPQIVSGDQGHTIRVWGLEGWSCLLVLDDHKGPIRSLAACAHCLLSCSQVALFWRA